MKSYLYKLITRPLIPIKGTWIDAAFFLAVFLLLFLSALALYYARKSERPRIVIRSAATIVFVFLIFFCVCLLRTSIYGLSQIGWDDFTALGNLFIFVMIGAFTLVMGRIFCGWICPFGFLQEITHKIFPIKKKKVKFIFLGLILALVGLYFYLLKPATDVFTENIIAIWAMGLLIIIGFRIINPKLDPLLLKIKYVSLVLYILVSGLFVFFSEAWCPIYGGEIDYASVLAFFVILLSSCVLCMAWCRYLCPTGTFLSIMSRFSIFKISKGKSQTTSAKPGEEICPTGAFQKDGIDTSTCIWCARCIRHCGNKLELR